MIGMIKIYMKKLWHGKFSIIIHYVIISIVCINLITDKVYAFDFDEKNFEFQSADYSDFFIINNEYNSERIDDYAINNKNEIAVATKKYINIYDSYGNYLYGYSVGFSGAYAIDLYDDTIEIYRIRQNDLIRLDNTGNIISVTLIDNSPANQEKISKVLSEMRSSIKYVGNDKYELNSSLTKLTKIDSNNNETLIYYMDTVNSYGDLFFIFCVAFVAILFIFNIMKKSKNINS